MADYRSLHGLSGADTEAQLEREAENERRRECCLFLVHKQQATPSIRGTHRPQVFYLEGILGIIYKYAQNAYRLLFARKHVL